MQQEALATLFISCTESPDVALASWDMSHKDLTTRALFVPIALNSLCCKFPAQHLILNTQLSPQSGANFDQLC
jgi:hypothetical protein